MLNSPASDPHSTAADRQARLQDILQRLRPHAEHILQQMAERLVDLPQDQAFGQVEYDLRDLGRDLAADAHQTGLQAGKKRGT